MSLYLCSFTIETHEYNDVDYTPPQTGSLEYRLVEAETSEQAKQKLIANLEELDSYGISRYVQDVNVYETIK